MAELRVHGVEVVRIPRATELRIHGVEMVRIPEPVQPELRIHEVQLERIPAPPEGGVVRVAWDGGVHDAVVWSHWDGQLHGPS